MAYIPGPKAAPNKVAQAARPPLPAASEPPYIYIVADNCDLPLAHALQKAACQRALTAVVMDKTQRREDFRRNLELASGVVFLHGNATRTFVEQWLNEFVKTTLLLKLRPKVALYEAPPEKTAEELPAEPIKLLHVGSQKEFTTAGIEQIGAELRGDKAAPAAPSPRAITSEEPYASEILSTAWATHQSAASFATHDLIKPGLRWDPADQVDCSVFARPELRAAQSFEVQALLHCRDDLIKAARLAQKKEQGVNRRGFASLTASIPRGASVNLFMESDSFIIQNPLQEAIWHGAPVCIAFTFELPSEPTEASPISRLHVSLNGTPIGELEFIIRVAPALLKTSNTLAQPTAPTHNDATTSQPLGVSVVTYRKAFISYSRKDFDQASLFAQGLEEHRIELCMDVKSFEPGDDFADQIHRNIRRADVFYLMWSKNAAESKWVLEEARRAVELSDASEPPRPRIKPITLHRESPQPPDFLSRFHFDSTWLAHRAAQASPIFARSDST